MHSIVIGNRVAYCGDFWVPCRGAQRLRRAMNLMLINVSTRKLRRAVRLPEGDLPALGGTSTSKSAASPRFVALLRLSSGLDTF